MILTTSVCTVIPTNYTCFRDIFTFSKNVACNAFEIPHFIIWYRHQFKNKLFQKFLTTSPIQKPQNRPKNSQRRKKTRKPISPFFSAPRPYHPALLQWLNKGDPRRHHNWLPHRNKRLEPPSERASVRYEEAPKAKPQGFFGTAPLSQCMGYIICRYYQFQWWQKIWPTLAFFCFFEMDHLPISRSQVITSTLAKTKLDALRCPSTTENYFSLHNSFCL